MSSSVSTTNSIIQKIQLSASRSGAIENDPYFNEFLGLYFAHLSIEDLNTYTTDMWCAVAKSHWTLIKQRKQGEISLRVFNPSTETDGWQSTHTIVELAIDDMPFLVDSMRMELNRMGLTTHQMVFFGGLDFKRDANNQVTDILPHSSGVDGCVSEAPIYMEIDRQSDADTLQSIHNALMRVLQDVQLVVNDWTAMRQTMQDIVKEYRSTAMQKILPNMLESKAFLVWLLDDHFTFLGYRDYDIKGQDESLALTVVSGSGMGVLRDETRSKVTRHYAELPDAARDMALSTDHCLIISKTNTRSTVHRPVYTDYIGVKRFDAKGNLLGERRFIGLYTSSAYSKDPETIPLLRQKVEQVLTLSGLPRRSHAGKDLIHIIANFPRDDLFHAPAPEIYRISSGILHLQERRRTRLFVRKDPYGRFVSCLVFVPRDNFNTDLAERMRSVLLEEFDALEVMMDTRFTESVLARIHFVVRVDPYHPVDIDFSALEKRLIDIGESWSDGLMKSLTSHFGEERANELMVSYRLAFPAGYRDVFSSKSAVHDIAKIEKLSVDCPLEMSFYRPIASISDVLKLKLFRANFTVPLSDTVPMLENLGFRVLGEQAYQVILRDGRVVWVNDFSLVYSSNPEFELSLVKDSIQAAFLSVWQGHSENDAFNRLVIEAKLTWREVTLLRAYAKYFMQIGFTYSQQYIEQTLVKYPAIARLLVDIFSLRFMPTVARDEEQKSAAMEESLSVTMDAVATLDEDRIITRYLDVIRATNRTNYYQLDANGDAKVFLSLKIDPSKISDMPKPLPFVELFVYSPRFEGVHLRAEKVARGGLRWSDRREDFRVEVLGLMKAQQVKNAVIVPAGAKGGFVPKCLPVNGTREEVLAEAVACYQQFIRGLLDVTDNLSGKSIVPPKNVRRYDDDDPYLVVAADKGTATFSDIANAISTEYGFWLGDAFASGGCTGYDHKKMGITARGAWVAAQRHFQELALNADHAVIRVVGIGDMSGDVFGNGLLMSPHMKLVAAFNHQHIFIDPNPAPKKSYLERKRLFELPRSSWTNYNPRHISEGGGVYDRSSKAIKISAEAKAALGITKDILVPSELIQAILKAPVDMIWNGGIGTYIKATDESDSDVGDRTNDALRVNAADLRTRVVCEGGNLGVTQRGRIEYELTGGKLNTDFIDNSAGVDCSDHEVNIKILLNAVMEQGLLDLDGRNALLESMSDEVAELVLAHNYHQNQAISLASIRSPGYMGLYIRYINTLEKDHHFDRKIECVPDDKILFERRSSGLGLTRPEISILFSYSKIILKQTLLDSDLPEDPYFECYLTSGFPSILHSRYREQMRHHRLRREIIATQLSNSVVSDMGLSFVYQMQDETGAPVTAVVRAYVAAKEIFNVMAVHESIEALDYVVDAETQYHMILSGISLVRRATRWFLRNRRETLDIAASIAYFKKVTGVFNRLPKLLVGANKAALEARKEKMVQANVPPDIALRLASAPVMYHGLNIIEAAATSNTEVYRVAKIYFTLVDRLELLWFRDRINDYPVEDRWSVLAKAAFKGDLDLLQRELTVGVLNFDSNARSIPGRINAWLERHAHMVSRWESVLADLRSTTVSDFAILSVAIRELSDLAQTGLHRRRRDRGAPDNEFIE